MERQPGRRWRIGLDIRIGRRLQIDAASRPIDSRDRLPGHLDQPSDPLASTMDSDRQGQRDMRATSRSIRSIMSSIRSSRFDWFVDIVTNSSRSSIAGFSPVPSPSPARAARDPSIPFRDRLASTDIFPI